VVFLDKAYGYHTYDSTEKVKLTDLYDIASITKVAATTTAMMKLYENGTVKLDRTLSDYLPELKKTNKSEIVLMDVLTHQSRLQPGIPFYMNLLLPLTKQEKAGSREFSVSYDVKLGYDYLVHNVRNYKPGYFSRTPNITFGNQVADSLFTLTSYKDTMFSRIATSSLLSRKEYRYSDIGFIYLYKVIDKMAGEPLQDYVRDNFYSHLGATTLGYTPLQRFKVSDIVPTELDLNFRHQLIHGYVHDQTAALMGGVSGHAGLFSNANDLAKLFQMFLNEGAYGGERLLQKETVDLFISSPFRALGNRRGIGFDKPETNPLKINPVCDCVSSRSFGHSGFTGTLVWADPDTGLLFIFLSNRVYPSADNNKLTELGVRTKILEVLSKSIKPPLMARM
jgi:CubicO group peptidase (beta-lactamase class C family)